MPVVGGLDIHRKQITFDYLDTVTGEVRRGQIAPADRAHLRLSICVIKLPTMIVVFPQFPWLTKDHDHGSGLD